LEQVLSSIHQVKNLFWQTLEIEESYVNPSISDSLEFNNLEKLSSTEIHNERKEKKIVNIGEYHRFLPDLYRLDPDESFVRATIKKRRKNIRIDATDPS